MREFIDRRDYEGFFRYRAKLQEEETKRNREELREELGLLDEATREKLLARVRAQTNPGKNPEDKAG